MRDLDEELFEHLRISDSVIFLAKEGFNPHLVLDLDVRSFAVWVFDYFTQYGVAPIESVIEREWEFTEEASPELEVAYLLEKLRERYVENGRRETIERLIDETDPTKFSELMISESYKIWKTTTTQKHILSLEDHPEIISEIIEEASNEQRGASYGFISLDKLSGGAKAGHLSFLAARPKRYKTWIGLKAFVEQRKSGTTPVFFNLELSDKEIYQRLICLVSGTSFTHMKHGLTTETEWKRIRQSMETFKELGPAYIVSPPYEKRTVDDIVLETQRLQADSVIIDQLSYLQWKGRIDSEHQGYRQIVHGMKNAAIKLEMPWYCICQFNREAANLEEMAGADKAGLTRAIEETCDMMLGLHRTKEEMEMNQVELGIIEARHCSASHNWMLEVDLSTRTAFIMKEER